LSRKISIVLKAGVTKFDPTIFLEGRGQTYVSLSKTGEHARVLRLKNKDNVKLTLERVK